MPEEFSTRTKLIIGMEKTKNLQRAKINYGPGEFAVIPLKIFTSTSLYIALEDRWVPECILTREKTNIITRVIASYYDPSYHASEEEKMSIADVSFLGSANTFISEYVWLPIRFIDGTPKIYWLDEWRIEDFY